LRCSSSPLFTNAVRESDSAHSSHLGIVAIMQIEVGTGHWFAPLPPPNRTGGSPASGSPVSGLLHDGD
jgi:hypothetical protein